MSARLNKICKELNIGLQTVIDFLERNGYTDEWSLLSKIEDDQYEMVVKHFGAGC